MERNMRKLLIIIFLLCGCAIINDQKQRDYFNNFSIPAKNLLGVRTCKSFENKYVENYDWDKAIKLETEILNISDQLKQENELSSINVSQAKSTINTYFEMPSVYYRNKKMKDLTEVDGENYESYKILSEVAGFCLKNNMIQEKEKTIKLKTYWSDGGIKVWISKKILSKIEFEQINMEQKAEFMKTFNKSKIYNRFKKAAPSMIEMPVRSLTQRNCKIEDVIIGMALLSNADNRFSKQENYSFSVQNNILTIKVSDIFRINFEQQEGKLTPIEYYIKNENNSSDDQEYINRATLGAVYMTDILCNNSELVY